MKQLAEILFIVGVVQQLSEIPLKPICFVEHPTPIKGGPLKVAVKNINYFTARAFIPHD